jgi:anti-sigma factor RsiW
MNCEHCHAVIDDYVDGTLDAGDRGRVEAHVASCAACRALAEDLQAIRRAAGTLERHQPPARAWTRLAASLDAERSRRFGWRPPSPGLALAATLLLVVGGTSWMLWQQMQTPAAPARTQAPASVPADPELVQSVETELKLAEEHYQKAIAGLEQITRTESAALDPQVASVLQKNLEVIDQAIGESRAALQTQPTSEVAQESLFEALRNKVSLLQDTVVLINEMRKGNQEGAARIVSGLNQ